MNDSLTRRGKSYGRKTRLSLDEVTHNDFHSWLHLASDRVGRSREYFTADRLVERSDFFQFLLEGVCKFEQNSRFNLIAGVAPNDKTGEISPDFKDHEITTPVLFPFPYPIITCTRYSMNLYI